MRTFVIDESKWRCGGNNGPNMRGAGNTSLENVQGYQCCLGQISLQLGLSRGRILLKSTPAMAMDEIPLLSHGSSNTELACHAMGINDASGYSHEERKEKLKELFARHDIELLFEGVAE